MGQLYWPELALPAADDLESGFSFSRPRLWLDCDRGVMQLMIQDTLAELQNRIESASAVSPESKAELQRLVTTLRQEIAGLARTHGEDAQSIAGFTNVSAHEALREKRNPELVKLSLDGLASSVSEFQETHPALVQLVNRICQTLSNLGI